MPESPMSVKQVVACCAASLLPLTGCVKRTETIQVQPDGRVRIVVELEGDLQDVMEGDASFNDPGPWTVSDVFHTKDDGDQELCRTATLDLNIGAAFPTHYAGNDEDLARASLTMTTEVLLDRQPEGTYYHFKRVYHRRGWADVDYFRTKLTEDVLKTLDGKDFQDLDADERLRIADTLIKVEAIKMLVLSENAGQAIQPPFNQLEWLAVHRAIAQTFKAVDPDRVVELLGMKDADDEIQAQVMRINDEIENSLASVFGAQGAAPSRSRAFFEQLEFQRLAYAISEDLGDEQWEVKLELPGIIVGHNSFDKSPEGGSISWNFDGDALYDRDQVLMASSFLPRS